MLLKTNHSKHSYFGIHRLEVSVPGGGGSEAGEGLGGGVEGVGAHGLGVHRHAQLLQQVPGPRDQARAAAVAWCVTGVLLLLWTENTGQCNDLN